MKHISLKSTYENFYTSQKKISDQLPSVLKKYQVNSFLKPIPLHQQAPLALIKSFIAKKNRPLILDSCCGTGLSTKNLAHLYSDHIVIGIDKSQARLSRAPSLPSNCLLVRADIVDMWRLLLAERIIFDKHFMFYPNPWPKSGHLKRRFYAHPSFLHMLKLAPYFELRSNWKIFIDEAKLAFEFHGLKVCEQEYEISTPISLFEKKYQESQCCVYQLKAQNPLQQKN
ncbi:MAG: hypothetical protein KC505_01030 [Myxococcales bacterium]|nr:hypothetical protein [Myxococcales bacterium]USN49911.1 MAG: SAM-dependent methyltransferase [Myxococcales bacterium]